METTTTVPVLAKGKTITGRLWTYVRGDWPFAGPAPPAVMLFNSRDRAGKHPNQHLAGYAGILQADTYAEFNDLYDAARKPGPVAGRRARQDRRSTPPRLSELLPCNWRTVDAAAGA